MLDDLKTIHMRDAHDALGALAKQSAQLRHQFEIAPQTGEGLQNVAFAAMGGSAVAAEMARLWPGLTVPMEAVRDYDLPEYVSGATLCICASSSGNTEETLSALRQAEQRGARIAVITGGGKLAEIAQQRNSPVTLLPRIGHPRYGTLLNYKAVIDMLSAYGLCDGYSNDAIESAALLLETATAAWAPEIPTAENSAKQLAQELMGRSVVVYSGSQLAPAAQKWKIGINENAKQIAWTGRLPEFSHNEMTGWTGQPHDKPYAVVELRSSLEHPRVTKRFELTERLLSGRLPAPLTVEAEGGSALEQLLWTTVLGDYVSVYLAILNGVDPVPLDLVGKFKKLMEA